MKSSITLLSLCLAIASTSACGAAPADRADSAPAGGTEEILPETRPVPATVPAEQAAPDHVPTLRSDDPVELVRALYDGRPWKSAIPGGAEAWHQTTRSLWGSGAHRISEHDFLTAGPGDAIANLRIEPGDSSDGEAQVIVTFDKGADKGITIYFGTIKTDDGWQIAHVWRDDGWHLVEKLEGQ